MREQKRVFLLIVLLVLATGIVAGTVFLLLYRAAMSEERGRLTETVTSQARLIEAIARHDMAYKPHIPGGPLTATVSRIADAHENYTGFGKTGTFTLARREGNSIEFLLVHSGRKMTEPLSVPWHSNLAQPMQRALSGESGTMIGLDYQGHKVLAAYEPVAILDLGIVAKIDLWEVRAPFIRAGMLAGMAMILVSLSVAVLILRITRPMIRQIEIHAQDLEKTVSDLEKSEERSRLIMERNPDSVLILSQTGEILFANPASEQLFQRPPEVLKGVQLGIPSANQEFSEITIAARDGQEKTVEMRPQTIHWEGQDALIVSLRDVTEKKEAAERIHQLNQTLRAIRDVNQLITHEKDAASLIQKACGILNSNNRFRRVWIALIDDQQQVTEVAHKGMGETFALLQKRLEQGYYPACVKEVIGGTNPVVFEKGSATCKDCPLNQDYADECALVVPMVQNSRNYGILVLSAPFEIAADKENQSLYQEAAEDIAFALSSIEIEKKQARFQRALMENEARFRLLVENAPVGILVMDRDGSLRDFNEKGVALLNNISSNAAEVDNLLALSPLMDAGISADIETCFKTGRLQSRECPCRRQGGGRIFIRYHLAPIVDGERNVSAVQMIMEDISETRELENRLRQAQKMEAIGTLAGGIAHDFNNILAAILGYSQLFMTEISEDSPLLSHIQEILKAGERARDLVRQILTFSRQAETEPVPLQPHLIVKEAIRLLRSTIPTTIEIKQHIFSNTGTILADPTQIHQVVMNLCTNAYQAMLKEGGTLEIRLESVTLHRETDFRIVDGQLSPGDYVGLTVKDTGTGIAPEALNHLFDPYFTTKEKGQGTGLGLSVVHGIVTNCNGGIAVNSEPGLGTTFHVLFPKFEKEASVVREEAEAPASGGDERILMVDDEQTIVFLGKQMLEKLGYTVETCVSSLDALKRITEDPDGFDLLITDMTMPNMTGDKLAAEVKKIRSGFPVIICTGYSDLMNEEKAAALGIEGFLMKPLGRDSLGQMVRQVLNKR